MKSASSLPESVRHFFETTPLLSQLCEQNGWLDEDSLEIGLLESGDKQSLFEVRFEEILKEGSGCECGRNRCWGQFSVELAEDGQVLHAHITAGVRS